MSEAPDIGIGIDSRKVAALAARLGATPRELLALAARLATTTSESPLDKTRVDQELARVRNAGAQAAAATEILLLGYGSYSADDIDRALEMVWAAGSGIGDS
jgi:sigma54-dependent transcription regulator